MARNIEKLDKSEIMLVPGQKVRVVRTVDIAVEIDIREYLDGDTEIWANELELEFPDNSDVRDMLDQWDDAEITDVAFTIVEIL